MRTFSRVLFLSLIGAVGLAGCGRIGPPLAPELVAPRAPSNLVLTPSPEGIEFTWNSPDSSVRGDTLRSIEGYRVYRKQVQKRSEIFSSDGPEFLEIAEIADGHLVELNSRKQKARAEGLPSRRLKPDPSLTAFSFRDTTLRVGSLYVYKVVPFNNGGVEGDPGAWYRVLFRGTLSEVVAIPQEMLGAGLS